MLAKLIFALSISLLGAGGIATQSALDIQQTAFSGSIAGVAEQANLRTLVELP